MSDETLSPKQMDDAVERAEADTAAALAAQAHAEKLVTDVYVRPEYVLCPHCSERIEGWMQDPRGSTDTCDSCKKPFRVSPDASIKFR